MSRFQYDLILKGKKNALAQETGLTGKALDKAMEAWVHIAEDLGILPSEEELV